MHSIKKVNLNTTYSILRYQQGFPGRGIFFEKKTKKTVEGFIDAYWASN